MIELNLKIPPKAIVLNLIVPTPHTRRVGGEKRYTLARRVSNNNKSPHSSFEPPTRVFTLCLTPGADLNPHKNRIQVEFNLFKFTGPKKSQWNEWNAMMWPPVKLRPAPWPLYWLHPLSRPATAHRRRYTLKTSSTGIPVENQ